MPWICRTRVIGLVLLAVGAPEARAQRPADLAAVDSAAAARAAWARGVAAFNAKDYPTAKREVDRAATAWPVQPAYRWGQVLVAARSNDTVGLARALRSYASLGLGRDFRADSTLAAYLELPGFAPIVAAHDANRSQLTRSRIVATLPDSTFWPEGMDYDPRSKSYYVASVRHRTVAEVRTVGSVRSVGSEGSVRELWPRGQVDLGAIFGVRVDPARRVLWVTTSGWGGTAGYAPKDSAIAALLRVKLPEGRIERRWNLPVVPGGHTLGDLAVGPKGDVYVTDSNQPVLYRLRSGADSLERVTSPLFRSLQGVAPTPDGKLLYIADYSHGLLRLELSSKQIIRLEDAPGSISVGCDGIAWDRGAIVAVQNGVAPARVMRFQLDPTGTRIVRAMVLDRNVATADEPTIGAIAGKDFVYVANSQWEKYTDKGARRPGTTLVPPILLAVPLPEIK